MGRHYALEKEEIQDVLRLIDTGLFTQKDIARKYGVTPATISNYNRITRLKFRIEDNARIIASQNIEILRLKEELNIDTTYERLIPKSFKMSELVVVQTPRLNSLCKPYTDFATNYLFETSDKDDDTKKSSYPVKLLTGYKTKHRDDAIMYINRHPEYYLYTLKPVEKNNPNIKFALQSNCRPGNDNKCIYFITRVDLGYIPAFKAFDSFGFLNRL